jgi:ubiquinone/menaquinone biosynthesis C-methylase UbiE
VPRGAWRSAELLKQPRVFEVATTDVSPKLLKEQALKVFKMLNTDAAKITWMPGGFRSFDFPNNHFDFAVCSDVLPRAANIVQVLREAKQVLKPGGRQLLAIREPVWPLFKIKLRAKMLAKLVATGVNERLYTLADSDEFFKQASLPLQVKRVKPASRFNDCVNEVVNGPTYARYAFVGNKCGRITEGRLANHEARRVKQ